MTDTIDFSALVLAKGSHDCGDPAGRKRWKPDLDFQEVSDRIYRDILGR